FLILGFHFVEVLLLFPGTREGLARAGLLDFACLLQTSALQAALLAQLLGGGFAIKARNVLERADTGPRAAGKKVALLFVMIAGFGAMLRIVQSGVLLSPKPLTGAHYYSWFPENWVAGYSGREMLPPVLPALGEYDSGNRAVFEQHVAWAKRAGVGFLVFDWWAQRTSIDRRIRSNIEHLRPDSGMQFSLMYESLELKQSSKGASSAEPSNVVYLTRQRAWEMRRHWTYLARTFMAHPSYLKFENRPVLFVYATRHLVGPVAEAVQEARQHVKEKTGLDLYLVGDEVFFNVVSLDRTGKIVLLPELQPDWDRLNAFDALTAYNPYDSTRTQYAGQSGADIFLTDVENLYRRYRGICAAAGIRFFPGVLPGYNDRALRPKEDHYVVPRKIGPDRAQDFFAASISRWAMTLLDQSLPVMLVTSWNEWNEGTQIEPALKSPPTDRDRSESGTAVSQGEHHEGYGEYYLKMLRNPLN
ncbi:MAG TPA: glycoside hydrolase family 99-like domain-containing protein, partial [Oligoflexia bacterium]|nr:glycoside hydrolase family 99-like domain-containing protein [Oligoflexia bacterium]